MTNHGKTRSTVQPEPIIIDEYSVWVHSNIEPISESTGDYEFDGFEYDMIQYDKNEYIRLMAERVDNIAEPDGDYSQKEMNAFVEGMMGGAGIEPDR